MAREGPKAVLAASKNIHTFGRAGRIVAINLRLYVTILKIRREMPGDTPASGVKLNVSGSTRNARESTLLRRFGIQVEPGPTGARSK